MSRVEEIEAAIDGLPPEEYRRIAQWFRGREQGQWDEQMDADSSAGKLDFLFDEAEIESNKGLLREWPAPQARSPTEPEASLASFPPIKGKRRPLQHSRWRPPSRPRQAGGREDDLGLDRLPFGL